MPGSAIEASDLSAAEQAAIRYGELLATDHLAVDESVYVDRVDIGADVDRDDVGGLSRQSHRVSATLTSGRAADNPGPLVDAGAHTAFRSCLAADSVRLSAWSSRSSGPASMCRQRLDRR